MNKNNKWTFFQYLNKILRHHLCKSYFFDKFRACK